MEVSANETESGTSPPAGVAVKEATGGGTLTVMVVWAVLEPPELVAVSLAVNVPAPAYIWSGLWSVESGDPSPKFQLQLVGIPVEVSVNETSSGSVPLVRSAVNDATGGGTGSASDSSMNQ